MLTEENTLLLDQATSTQKNTFLLVPDPAILTQGNISDQALAIQGNILLPDQGILTQRNTLLLNQ